MKRTQDTQDSPIERHAVRIDAIPEFKVRGSICSKKVPRSRS